MLHGRGTGKDATGCCKIFSPGGEPRKHLSRTISWSFLCLDRAWIVRFSISPYSLLRRPPRSLSFTPFSDPFFSFSFCTPIPFSSRRRRATSFPELHCKSRRPWRIVSRGNRAVSREVPRPPSLSPVISSFSAPVRSSFVHRISSLLIRAESRIQSRVTVTHPHRCLVRDRGNSVFHQWNDILPLCAGGK